MANLPVPVVIVDHWGVDLPLAGVDSVLSDKFSGGYQGTVHMIRHGHTKIAVVCDDKRISYEAREFYKGYEKAMEDHGLSLPPLPDIPAAFRRAIIQPFLDWGVESFVVASDGSAASLIGTLDQLGKRVPDDVGVIGYDDEPFAGVISPKLSTVRVNKREMSRRATELLAERIQRGHRGQTRSIVIRPSVIARESCVRNCPDYHRDEESEINYLHRTAGLRKIERTSSGVWG
jgi:LacI family transcriptional regulator